MKKLLFSILILLGIVVLGMYFTDTLYFAKAVKCTWLRGEKTVTIDDFKFFHHRTIEAGTPQVWEKAPSYNKKELPDRLKELHEELETVAFLVVKNGKLVHESYYLGHDKDAKSHLMSVTKSYTSTLLQFAIQDGYIKSLDERVGAFLPDMKNESAKNIKLKDLSSLTSGIDWYESMESPFSPNVKLYYDDGFKEQVKEVNVVADSIGRFHYKECDHGLLGVVIVKATGKSLSEYASEKIWKPLGCEKDAIWTLDSKDGMEKCFAGLCSNARDVAKMGQLFLNKGRWNGVQLLNSAFIEMSVHPRYEEYPYYGYGWWIGQTDSGLDFHSMRGLLGQYITVIPSEKMVMVRLGKHRYDLDPVKHTPYDQYEMLELVSEAL